jgi:hypothetical protein
MLAAAACSFVDRRLRLTWLISPSCGNFMPAFQAMHRYARIDTLFLTGDDHLWGWFDEPGDRIVAHGSGAEGDIDLLDFSALMTLRQGGSVTLVAREALPPPGLSAAILRY